MKTNKDKTGLIMIVGVALTLSIIILGYIISPETVDNTPKAGDIWEFYGTGDPFKDEETYTRRVLEVKKGYVQFIENDTDTLTRRIPVFKYNSEKVSSKIKE